MSCSLTSNISFITSAIIASGLAVTLTACQQSPKYGYIEGETMGTSYHIRYEMPKDGDEQAILKSIDDRLASINHSMSTYQDDSLISTFNRQPANTPMQIDADFVTVLDNAKTIYQQSGGAFDPTVMPLIELWGFGKTMTIDRLQSPPNPEDIAAAKALIDFDAVILEHDQQQLTKTKDGVALDFSAIAKGYGVDVIAQVLYEQYHINNYMVEIGGEVATSGVNAQHKPWQIAIDAPVLDSSVDSRQTISIIRQPTSTNQLHLATSGNYRNSVIFDGKRYSHTIDPLTGNPIVGGAPSVSVVADSVMLADAWATALTAMPYSQALQLATSQNLAALFIVPKQASVTTHTIKDWQVVETPAMQALRSDSQGQ
ncbi:FAD:protein FMN transferase [Psychrobacter sp. I-STPA10]|uniref:FAD:protein FMN transferase n=1 Tax=Psychrobacter sp. I-STPA10 TaxID=2585769 RepID=UPI001E4AB806|nr:FAD:protein FMN transferase [Psychrobacter sp. I-STPA10]